MAELAGKETYTAVSTQWLLLLVRSRLISSDRVRSVQVEGQDAESARKTRASGLRLLFTAIRPFPTGLMFYSCSLIARRTLVPSVSLSAAMKRSYYFITLARTIWMERVTNSESAQSNVCCAGVNLYCTLRLLSPPRFDPVTSKVFDLVTDDVTCGQYDFQLICDPWK